MRAVALVLVCAAASAQSFEVASVKPSGPNDRIRLDFAPGGVTLIRVTLRGLLHSAYRVQDFEISGGPKWMDEDRFDVVAKTAAAATNPELRTMLGKLLEERFKLVIHREEKEAPGYALVAGKDGVKFSHSTADAGAKEGGFMTGGGKIPGTLVLFGKNANMEQFASVLSSMLRRKVVDETGVKGQYSFRVEYAPDGPAVQGGSQPDMLGPSLTGALPEQLGLKLEARKVKLEMLIVDSAEKPSSN